MNNVADVLRSQNNAGPFPTRRLAPAKEGEVGKLVLDTTIITCPDTAPQLCQIFEPSQKQGQEQVILEEFPMAAGEIVTRELQSATAGYRFVPLSPDQLDKLNEERTQREARAGDPRSAEALTVGQPGFVLPETNDEITTGQARLGEVQDAEERRMEFAEAGDGDSRERAERRATRERAPKSEAPKSEAKKTAKKSK
jgi:hypothetical protein